MSAATDNASGCVLANKPSAAFSTTSAGSATSAATSRSGGSRLLFGEIDTSSDRSSESCASVCSLVLSDSSTFLKFWLADQCRDNFLSKVAKPDRASLRLVCHDFSVRAAPTLFNHLSITFKTNTFTRPARLAALHRVGFHVKKLSFTLPLTQDTLLPPLVDPATGEQLSYTYTPQITAPATPAGKAREPKYGDWGTTEILTRQYPPIFHAATNVPAFTRAFSAFTNLKRLRVSCPGHDTTQHYRRSVIDFALVSLRIALERNALNCLDTLSLEPIHLGGILHLSPLLGYGATPRSPRRWSRIKNLNIKVHSAQPISGMNSNVDHFRLLQTYLSNFSPNLTHFHFEWMGGKGPSPLAVPSIPAPQSSSHPAFSSESRRPLPPRSSQSRRALYFPRIQHLELENSQAAASDINAFITTHKRTLEELNFEHVQLISGTWDQALASLTQVPSTSGQDEVDEIPIMFTPEQERPNPTERVAPRSPSLRGQGKSSTRVSSWLSRGHRPSAGKKVRDGLLGCEEQLKKVLRGNVFPWR